MRQLAWAVRLVGQGAWALGILAVLGVCLGVDVRSLSMVLLGLAVTIGTGAVVLGSGSSPPAVRWGLRLAWVPFVVVLGTGWLPWSLAPLLIAPLALGTGWLLFSHVWPGSAPWRRLRVDAALAAVVLAPAWTAPLQLPWVPILSCTPHELDQILLLVWVLAALALFFRLPFTANALEPPERLPVWQELADREGWVVSVKGERWEALTPWGLHVVVLHDPVPVETVFVLSLPELAGLTVCWGSGQGSGDLALGDPVLDNHIAVQGDVELARRALTGAREAWLQVIHGWGGLLQEGKLTIALQGDDPTRWLRLPEGTSSEEALKQVISSLEELCRQIPPRS